MLETIAIIVIVLGIIGIELWSASESFDKFVDKLLIAIRKCGVSIVEMIDKFRGKEK